MTATRDDTLHFLTSLGAHETPHSGRNLLEHLRGTAAIVERWGGSEDATNAALLHSVYGTEYFRRAPLTFEDRPRIVELVGPYAERLVWIFCAFDRSSLFRTIERGAPYHVVDRASPAAIPVSRDEVRDLLLIFWANLIDHPGARPQRHDVEQSASFLPEAATEELRLLVRPDGARSDVRAREAGEEAPPGVRPATSVNTTTSSVATLLCRDSMDELLETDEHGVPAWLRRPFLAHGPVSRLAGLVDFTREELFAMPRSFAKAFYRDERGGSTSCMIQPGEEEQHYQAGHTVYLHSLHAPTVDVWIEAVSAELGLLVEATRVSCFASKAGPGPSGLKAHYDPNDNIVCQVRGHKRWRYSLEQAVPYATSGQTVGQPLARVAWLEGQGRIPAALPEPSVTVDMLPGSCMVMPRGIWHETETVEESIHLNIQTGTVTWKDVLDFILQRCPFLHAEVMRAPAPNLSGHAFDQALARRVRALAEAIAATPGINLDNREFRAFVARRRSA